MALRLTAVIPASRSPPPPSGSRSTFQERLGANSVRFPLLTRENLDVWNTTPDPDGGMCRWSAGSVGHRASRAPSGATTGSSSGLGGPTPSGGQPGAGGMWGGCRKLSSLVVVIVPTLPLVQGRIGQAGPAVSAACHIGDLPGATLTWAGQVPADP